MNGVAFFAHHGNHEAVLRPVVEALEGRLPSFLTSDEAEVARLRPEILVLPGHVMLEWFRQALPETLIGSVRHGLIAKRGLERRRLADREARFDFVCVGDQMTADRYSRLGAEPSEFWFTGYPQIDRLFRGDPPPDLGLEGRHPVVLYAPTWNRFLSSAPMLGDRVADLIRGDGPPLDVIIKPHPTTPEWRPEWLRWWSELAARDPHVLLTDPRADVTSYMLAADLLVSDASSTIFEFMALDRPIVLLTNPRATEDRDYDADDICWRWRDVGTEVTDVRALASTVAAELAAPERRSGIRRRYAGELFGDLRDGGNASRIADRLVDLAARLEAGSAPAPIPLQRVHPARAPRTARATLATRTGRSVRRTVSRLAGRAGRPRRSGHERRSSP